MSFTAALGVAGLASQLAANSANKNQSQRALDQARYQYEDSKIYNSALMQVNRLRAAGINPALAFGKDAGMAQTQSVPTAIPQQGFDLGGLAALAQGATNNDANKAKTLAETRLDMIKADSQQFDLALNKMFGTSERSAGLGHTLADISRLYQDALLAKEEGNTERAKQSYYAFQGACADALAKKHGKEREMIEKELEWYDERISVDLGVKRSEIGRNYASAEESRASAANYRANTALTNLVKSIREATSTAEITRAFDDAALADIEVQVGRNNVRAAQAAAEQAQYASDHKEWLFWKDFGLDILHGAVSVADVKSRLMSSRAFQQMSRNDQKRVENQATDIAKRYELGKESNRIKSADRAVRTWKYDENGKAHKTGQTDYRTY